MGVLPPGELQEQFSNHQKNPRRDFFDALDFFDVIEILEKIEFFTIT